MLRLAGSRRGKRRQRAGSGHSSLRAKRGARHRLLHAAVRPDSIGPRRSERGRVRGARYRRPSNGRGDDNVYLAVIRPSIFSEWRSAIILPGSGFATSRTWHANKGTGSGRCRLVHVYFARSRAPCMADCLAKRQRCWGPVCFPGLYGWPQ